MCNNMFLSYNITTPATPPAHPLSHLPSAVLLRSCPALDDCLDAPLPPCPPPPILLPFNVPNPKVDAADARRSCSTAVERDPEDEEDFPPPRVGDAKSDGEFPEIDPEAFAPWDELSRSAKLSCFGHGVGVGKEDEWVSG